MWFRGRGGQSKMLNLISQSPATTPRQSQGFRHSSVLKWSSTIRPTVMSYETFYCFILLETKYLKFVYEMLTLNF